MLLFDYLFRAATWPATNFDLSDNSATAVSSAPGLKWASSRCVPELRDGVITEIIADDIEPTPVADFCGYHGAKTAT